MFIVDCGFHQNLVLGFNVYWVCLVSFVYRNGMNNSLFIELNDKWIE